jgi:hypothetical protein
MSMIVDEAREDLVAEMTAIVRAYALTRTDIERAAWTAVRRTLMRTGRRPRGWTCRELLDVLAALQETARRRAH